MGRFTKWGIILAVGFSCVQTSRLVAEPVIEKLGGVDLDWGDLKIKFSGLFKPSSQEAQAPATYSEAEREALTNGLRQVKPKIIEVYNEQLKLQGLSRAIDGVAAESSELLNRDECAYESSFYKDGSVRVHIESSLARLFARENMAFLKKVKTGSDDLKKDSRFSGLVLRLDKVVKPVASYEVLDNSGMRLFSMQNIQRDAYEKRLMGRWLLDPQRDELIKYVGKKPVSIQLKVVGPNRFVVQKGVWLDALQDSQGLLSEAKIIIVPPNVAM